MKTIEIRSFLLASAAALGLAIAAPAFAKVAAHQPILASTTLATGGDYAGQDQQVAAGGDYVGQNQQVAAGGDYVGQNQQVATGGDYVGQDQQVATGGDYVGSRVNA